MRWKQILNIISFNELVKKAYEWNVELSGTRRNPSAQVRQHSLYFAGINIVAVKSAGCSVASIGLDKTLPTSRHQGRIHRREDVSASRSFPWFHESIRRRQRNGITPIRSNPVASDCRIIRWFMARIFRSTTHIHQQQCCHYFHNLRKPSQDIALIEFK